MEVYYKDSLAVKEIGKYLKEHFKENSAIVCIGTDKCIVDSLAPLIGTMLCKGNLNIDIYGTLSKPVHAMNIHSYAEIIKSKRYDNIIALDACLSNIKDQGIIEIREGSITPGKGIGKILPEIGDLSIIGIVDSSDKEFHDLVQDTRLSFIYEMAEVITQGILTALTFDDVKEEIAEIKMKRKFKEILKDLWNKKRWQYS